MALGFIVGVGMIRTEAVKAQPAPANPANPANAQAASAAATRQAALKKLIAAQGEVAKAIKTLAEAEGNLLNAKGDEEKAKARERVVSAKKQLESAQAAVEARMKDAEATGGRRIFMPGGPMDAADDGASPDDPVVRFLLFPPGGPLVVEASITVDGKPFRKVREAILDNLLAHADKNGDGKTVWDEALRTSRFGFGRLRQLNDVQRHQYQKTYDANTDEIVDRDEARRFFNAMTQTQAFSVSSRIGYSGISGAVGEDGRVYNPAVSGSVNLLTLLDGDADQALSAKEISAATEQLKRRDADDNDLLTPQEITTAANRTIGGHAAQTQRRQLALTRALALNQQTSSEHLFRLLRDHYQDAQGELTKRTFHLVPEVFATLDANASGHVEESEVLKLRDVPAHLELEVDLGKETQSVKLKSAIEKVQTQKAAEGTVSLEWPGIRLSTHAAPTTEARAYYNQIGESYRKRFDANANGYLEKDELGGNYASLFVMWDLDEDGKVYEKEIVEAYGELAAAQNTQVRASMTYDESGLFQHLEQSGDNRLSLREMRAAPERLRSFDKNQDGQITADEVPLSFALSFSLGFNFVQGGRPVVSPQNNSPKKTEAPNWFTKMDNNGDGDLTMKEFLGDKAQFEAIDTNKDGFIEPKEANAAGK
jgi:Ca2+-binding EF-hand superfamily protein